jgi:hypothetical protein
MRFFVRVLLAALLLPLSARSQGSDEIPFQYREGLLWVDVKVAGKAEPLHFLLDSGAGVSVLDLGTARRLGVKLGNRQPVQGVEGQGVAYRVEGLRGAAGGLALPRSALAVDLRALSGRGQRPVEGLLGADAFRGRVVQIDFGAGKIRWWGPREVPPLPGEVLPLKRRNGALCVLVRVAGGPAQWLRLDTGCDAALEWAPRGTQKPKPGQTFLGLSGASTRQICVGVQLGAQRFAEVTAGLHPGPIFPNEAGLLGNGLLSKFRLTIDEPRSRLTLERVR